MEISINGLVERVEDFLFERATVRYRWQAGLGPRPSSDWAKRHQSLASAETFAFVRETLANPRTDESARPALSRLLGFLGGRFEESSAAGALAELHATREKPLPSPVSMPLESLLLRVGRIPDRTERDAAAKAATTALEEGRSAWARKVDVAIHAAATLGFQSHAQLQEALADEPNDWTDECRRFLAATDDAYRDLLAYSLKKIDSQLKPKDAQWHDLERVAEAPWLDFAFRREDQLDSVLRTISELSFDPSAQGRLFLDSERREGKRPGVRAMELRVPDEVRLVIDVEPGMHACAKLLGGFARALSAAYLPRALPLLERRLRPQSVTAAVHRLFSRFLMEEGWLRRFRHLEKPQAREVARAFALRELSRLRRTCVRHTVVRELYQRGPVPPIDAEFNEHMSEALLVEVPGSHALECALFEESTEVALWAEVLEAELLPWLRERFNEDFFRNPACGRKLTELFAAPQPRSFVKLPKGPPSLLSQEKRLLQVMSA
ncbi:MAG: hypothetical protein QM723_16520 [Myxococcaceae bacterium]